jgi:hypothetical protein
VTGQHIYDSSDVLKILPEKKLSGAEQQIFEEIRTLRPIAWAKSSALSMVET